LQLIGGCQDGKGKMCIIFFGLSFFLFRSSEGGSCTPQLENVTFNDTSNFDLTTHQWIGIFGAILGGAILIALFKSIFAYIMCLNASRNLHNKMFKSILRAPILFFDTNPVGK